MDNFAQVEIHRMAWAVNDIKKIDGVNRMVASHLCYAVRYGSKPVYMINELKTGRVSKFVGSIEALRKHFKVKGKVVIRCILKTKAIGYTNLVSTEDKDKFIDDQVDDEFKPKVEDSPKAVAENRPSL